MLRDPNECGSTLIREIEERVHQTTHGRIRDLAVEEVQGQYVVKGRAPSHYARQLALHGALQLLTGKSLKAAITVG